MGSDSRPSYLSGNYVLTKYDNPSGIHQCYTDVKKQIRRIRYFEKYSDYIVNHPPTSIFHSKPFLAFMHIGFPCEEFNDHQPASERIIGKIRVLHAPTNRFGKGTEEIIGIIDRLKTKGIEIELDVLENVSNKMVLDSLKNCDFVIDEMYSDIPLGGLGVEAAMAGKLVFNSGYYTKYIESEYPKNVIPPSYFCEPDKLESFLFNSISRNENFRESGIILNEFVRRNYHCLEVARKFSMIIADKVPTHWYFSPRNISYLFGYGISHEKLKVFLKQYVDTYGKEALFLQNSYDFEKRM